ncbi:membrane or secreted protein [Gillisia sp. M10.2A]|uniref:Membrane or secreted protein n=1 Tax=Gillisia lutea TaxID=2909668 RepID=A0ABS9EHN1_9FLAO|nr:membrane or secreted protein [Gillisia lutea]MCF4102351.1 membrane or secreted protein [Gillisia lutea]
MKKTVVVLICTLISIGINAQNVIGAWENYVTSENGEKLRKVIIYADGYQVLTTYNANTGKFIRSVGGTWSLDGDVITQKVEFHTENSELVGTEGSFKVIITDDIFEMVDKNMKFIRIDNGEPGKLQGAWLMSGRTIEGKTQLRETSGPRKTMKILSGTRFQWIAYNTETKQFMGTGGGTYTTINGEYTENIEFFSRDDSKVGLSLKFNYSLIDGKWHHTGLSSKGDPINEIWSVRE